jgi:hypothetical protein
MLRREAGGVKWGEPDKAKMPGFRPRVARTTRTKRGGTRSYRWRKTKRKQSGV